jgi:hypothetical protein
MHKAAFSKTMQSASWATTTDVLRSSVGVPRSRPARRVVRSGASRSLLENPRHESALLSWLFCSYLLATQPPAGGIS